MKVLLWSEGFWPHVGGIERFSEQLMFGLMERGFEFTVITSTRENTTTEDHYHGIPIFRVPMRRGLQGDIRALKFTLNKIKEIKEKFNPNLNHLNVAGPSFFYHLKTLQYQISPTVFTFHYLPPPSPNQLLSEMLEKSDWITGVSQITLKHIREFMPNITNRSSYIYNGLKKPSILSTPFSTKSNCLLSWGRLVPNKGFDLVLKAFAKISPYYPELRYRLIGDGPDKNRLTDLIYQLNIQDKVDFSGKHCSEQELFEAIRDCRFVIIPSHDTTETFGLSALEAMQMERPVITTINPGLNEVVAHEKTGLLFHMNSVESLEKTIVRLLNNHGEASAYALAGKKQAEKNFTIESMLKSYESLFKTTHERFMQS